MPICLQLLVEAENRSAGCKMNLAARFKWLQTVAASQIESAPCQDQEKLLGNFF